MYKTLYTILTMLLNITKALCKSSNDLTFENIMLRQQLATYNVSNVKPKISDVDRSLLIALKNVWTKWKDALIIVKPETVVAWQRRRFKSYWRKKSAKRNPVRRFSRKELRSHVFRMAEENRWGAPKIYSELLKLGFSEDEISQSTVSRYLRTYRSENPDDKKQQSWRTFLKNHRDVIAAMDFFVVPTVTFRLQYVLFIILHGKREILHFNITENPSASWVINQLREAFPFDFSTKYLIHDRDRIFSKEVRNFITASGISDVMTSYKCPWQNGVAERFVWSIKSELLNRVVVLNQKHLSRLVKAYVKHYNEDRCHLAVGRDSPKGRAISRKESESAKLVAIPKLGGLVHKYEWKNKKAA